MASKKDQIELFFEPESVAIVGASRKTGPGSFNIYENMLELGYSGEVYPVNPKADEILGRKSYSSVKEIKGKVDLAIVSTPRGTVIDILEDCAEKGIQAVVIVAQGFSDAMDEEGKVLEKKLVEIAEDNGIRILGPNTMGVHNYYSKLSTSFVPFRKSMWKSIEEWKSVGLVSQTGFFLGGLPGFRAGKAIDIGNSCDVSHLDVLRYYQQDPKIEQIFLHIEGLRKGREFLELAREVSEKKPILVLKTGKSEKGAQLATSHSGSMAGEDRIYESAFEQTGIFRVKDARELQVIAKAILNLPKMKGDGVGVVTHTGAGGIMVTDAVEEFGLEIAELSEKTIKKIKSLSPDWMKIENPVDIWPGMMINEEKGMEEVYGITLDSVLNDDSVDGVVCLFPSPETYRHSDSPIHKTMDVLKEIAGRHEKPVTVWLAPESEEKKLRSGLMDADNVAVFDSVRDAARVLSFLREDNPD